MFDPNHFRPRKKQLLKEMKIREKGLQSVSEYASMSGVPLTVLYTFIAEEYEDLREACEKKMEELRRFYGG